MSALSIRYESYFINMVFEGKSIQHIVNEAAQIIGTPVRFSPEGHIEYAICSPGYPQQDIEFITRMIEYEEGGFPIYLRLTSRPDVGKPFLKPDPDTGNMRIFCHVLIGTRHFGNISIPEVDKDLREVDMDFIELLVKTIALSCSVTGSWGYDVTKASLLQRILNGSIRTKEEVMASFGGYHEYEGKRWRLLSVSIPDQTEEAVIRSALQIIFPKKPMVICDSNAVMVFDVTDKDMTDYQKLNLERMVSTYACTILLSMIFDDLLMCREQMKSLDEHPASRKREPGFFLYDDHKEYALFFSTRLKKDQVLETLCGKLNTIKAYDSEHDTQYFLTLSTYIQCTLSVQRTAAALFTHKNTILYRVNRLQELFDIDLHDSQTVFHLSLGLSALEYWRE